ncbi:hypothetical protein [Chitinophaga rhizophila]|uniref:Uncharacterized protein n=1 Tax=Chitinophaga rhizophila TaxID=2866212 RepID=A0ABS7GFQ7_9BACT|nr:hypothetical protein [Chitinophaga rhizophila]MBW8685634.1 hypothetical protein [Chitinophaga rhizophila]
MNKLRKHLLLGMIALGVMTFASCSKEDPVPEKDQEEVGKTILLLQEVDWHGDFRTGHADAIANAPIDTIQFDEKGNAPVGFHLHLHTGHSYKMTLVARDYAGREIQQTFLERADIHQAVILGAPAGAIDYTYGDEQVGVTGYLHIVKSASTFTLQYLMRHLNPGVKAGVTADDWNNADYQQKLAGATDLDLKFELHPVD